MALLHLLHLEFPSTKFQYMKAATSAVCKFMKGCTLLTLWRDNMISKLTKLTFIGCIVIAASVPAEAGLFDRIRNRNGGGKVGCCQPQVVCAPALCRPTPCAPSPCSLAPCVAAPCQTQPTCLQTYHQHLDFCSQRFGNSSQECAECRRRAALAYCECIRDPGTMLRSYGGLTHEAMRIQCPLVTPDTPCADCDTMYDMCIAAGGPNCNRCWFACMDVCGQETPPPPPSLSIPNQ